MLVRTSKKYTYMQIKTHATEIFPNEIKDGINFGILHKNPNLVKCQSVGGQYQDCHRDGKNGTFDGASNCHTPFDNRLPTITRSPELESTLEEIYAKTQNAEKEAALLERQKRNADKINAKVHAKAVSDAQGDRDSNIKRAEGKARSIEIVSKAETAAITAKVEAVGGIENFVRLEMSKHIGNQTRTLVLGNGESALGATMMGINSALGVGIGLKTAGQNVDEH